MLFYYCRNCSHSAAILIDSHWTTNLIKFFYSTDSLFLGLVFFFWLNKGRQRQWLIWSMFKIWLVEWLLPQRRKRANYNCLLGWGHSFDLPLPLSRFFLPIKTLNISPPPSLEKQQFFTPLFPLPNVIEIKHVSQKLAGGGGQMGKQHGRKDKLLP